MSTEVLNSATSRAKISGFLDGRQNDWINRISGRNKGRPLSQSRGIRFIHAGIHRTGATFLQKVVFSAYDECTDLFSDDVIAGKLFDNGLDNIDRVREMVGDVIIILILRNQASMLNSAYRTYIKAGGVWTYGRYTDEIIARGKYDFGTLVGRYFEVFGKENVRVLFYEDMVADRDTYLANLLSIIGISEVKVHSNRAVNPGPTKYFNAGVRWLNILLWPFSAISWIMRLRKGLLNLGTGLDTHVIKNLDRGAGAKRQWGYAAATDRIHVAYGKGNKDLGEMLGRDISVLGYRSNVADK